MDFLSGVLSDNSWSLLILILDVILAYEGVEVVLLLSDSILLIEVSDEMLVCAEDSVDCEVFERVGLSFLPEFKELHRISARPAEVPTRFEVE